MNTSGSILVRNSVYFPNATDAFEFEYSKARRFLRRRDGSAILDYSSFVSEMPDGDTPLVPLDEWTSAAVELRAIPLPGSSMLARGGRVTTHISLRMQSGPVRVLLMSSMLKDWREWTPAIYISTPKLSGVAAARYEPMSVRIRGVVTGSGTRDSSLDQLDSDSDSDSDTDVGWIIEHDDVAQREKLGFAFNQAIEDLSRSARQPHEQARLTIEFGAGRRGFGIVVSREILEQLRSFDAALMICAVR